MELDNEDHHTDVYLDPDQVSLAIGKKGVNIKLAQELTGYSIDVYRDIQEEGVQYDIDLDEFSDEIEGWVIDEFKKFKQIKKDIKIKRVSLHYTFIDISIYIYFMQNIQTTIDCFKKIKKVFCLNLL